MARLFGLIGNRADLGVRVLELEREPLKVVSSGAPLGWGIGFHQAGEVLLRRRPIDERAEIDVASLARDVRADVLIGHVRTATVGALRTENTHPFRYRQWLFAQTGTVGAFPELRDRLYESMPEFLRRDVRGETDSELVFHLFLSFLHDAGRLSEAPVDAAATRNALRSTLALVDRLSAEEAASTAALNLLVTDGEHIVGVHRNATMAYRVVKGRADLERLLGDDALRRARSPDLASCRFCLVASDFDKPPRGWTDVPASSLVTVTRTAEPVVEPL